jgi:ATP adenylyltransferase
MQPNPGTSRETLWAPWRLSYIAGSNDQPTADGCFLCRYASRPGDDAANFVVSRSGRVFTVLNRFPYNNGHLLITTVAHKANLTDLDDEELLECQHALARLIEIITRTMSAEGFNVGLNLGRVGGAGVPGHLHWHLVPRWNGDTNFMPVLADANVIPQSLQALYDLLKSEGA